MNEPIQQRSEAWHAQRLGIPTASQFHRILTEKGNPAPSTANTYKWQLVAERIFGVSFAPRIDLFKAVRDGIANEDRAREAFAAYLKAKIEPAEFVMSQDRRFGCSPDGWVGGRPVEIKCPQIPGQLENLCRSPRKYWPQVQGQLLVTGCDQLEFWSWSPFAPPVHYQIPRDIAFCNTLHHHLNLFLADLDLAESAARAAGPFNIEGFALSLKREPFEEDEA